MDREGWGGVREEGSRRQYLICCVYTIITESEESSRDERRFPLTQYITNGRISRAKYTIMHFKNHHRVLRLISNRMSV